MEFSEKEVGKLIQRATELHEKSSGESDQGLSLSEVESIAAELGVPSRFLKEAALELKEGQSAKKAFSIWGAPFMVEETRLADAELSEQEWDEVLLELQRFSGKSGTMASTGQARHWTVQVGSGDDEFSFEKLKVTIRPVDDNQTGIHVRQEFQGAVVMYLMAFGVTSFLTLLVAHSLPDVAKITELIYAGMGGALSLGGVRALVATSTKRYRQKLSDLADRLRRIVDAAPNARDCDDTAVGKLEIPDQDVYLNAGDEQQRSEPNHTDPVK